MALAPGMRLGSLSATPVIVPCSRLSDDLYVVLGTQ